MYSNRDFDFTIGLIVVLSALILFDVIKETTGIFIVLCWIALVLVNFKDSWDRRK